MRRVVIVEDEALVRLGICSMLEKRSKDFSIAGEADNGNDAVEIIMETQPDIVLLDITMPGINGLEVLKTVRERGFCGYIMMLTCHDDFTYAQQAIRYGANDYILKNDISGSNSLPQLDELVYLPKISSGGATETDNTSRLENFFHNLFRIGLDDEQEFDRVREIYNFSIERAGLRFLVVHIQNYEKVIKRYEREEQDMLYTAMDHLLSGSLSPGIPHQVVRLSPENHILVLSLGNQPSAQKTHRTLALAAQRIHDNIKTFLEMDVLVGISREITQIKNINQDFTRLLNLLDRTFFFPDETTLWDAAQYQEKAPSKALQEFKQCLSVSMDKLLPQDTQAALDAFIEACRPADILPDKTAFLYVIDEFENNLFSRLNISMPPLPDNADVNMIKVRLAEMKNLLSNTEQPRNHLAAQAIKYIDSNFTKNISLEDIAEACHVSSSHLSRVFTKTMGRSISSYILEKRIELARYLISSTNLKHYEISEKCGLHSPAYFTSIFKKYTGLTPNEYRNLPR